jgi:phenylpyruvate tautomerase PptA (4-oxalocrotonate tautomerase family)
LHSEATLEKQKNISGSTEKPSQTVSRGLPKAVEMNCTCFYYRIMPHIRIRAIDESIVQKLSVTLPQELSQLMQTSIDNFTVEKVATRFYKNGVQSDGDPMIEVLWFDRGQEMKNDCAKKITELVKSHCQAEYIAVIFRALPRESYFENGEHF